MRNCNKRTVIGVLGVCLLLTLAAGTAAAEPTEISDAQGLQNISNDLSGDYILTDDIDMSGVGNHKPIGTETNSYALPFNGSLDGNGHNITGLSINRGSYDLGLFGVIGESGSVQDLTLRNVDVVGTSNKFTGALAGKNRGSISNVDIELGSVKGNYNGYGSTSARVLGGAVGRNDGDLSDVHTSVSVSTSYNYGGGHHVGGIVGRSGAGASLSNLTSDGDVSGHNNVGGLIATAEGDINGTGWYSEGSVSGQNDVGGLVGRVSGKVNLSGSYSEGGVSSSSGEYGETGDRGGGLVGYADGSISVTDSYTSGSVSSNSDAGGLVGRNDGDANLVDVRVEGSVSSSNSHGGGLVGDTGGKKDYAYVDNATVLGKVSGQVGVGGLIGRNDGETVVNDSYISKKVNGCCTGYNEQSKRIGGLVGYSTQDTEVRNSHAENVDGDKAVGGLVGNSGGKTNVTKSHSNGSVSGTNSRVGGLVGISSGDASVNESHSVGGVSGQNDVGGLLGDVDGYATIESSYSIGRINGCCAGYGETRNRIGGLVGSSIDGVSIADSYSEGKVDGDQALGGLVGNGGTATEVTKSYADGNVIGSNKHMGGLIGRSGDNTVTESFAKGKVRGQKNVGGIVGYSGSSTNIDGSYSEGNIRGCCAGWGESSNRIGGLIGFTDGGGTELKDSYASGSVSGASGGQGALIGRSDGGQSVKDTYWDTSVGPGSGTGTGLTTEEMTGRSAPKNMTGLDFENRWAFLPSEYPPLRWQLEPAFFDVNLTGTNSPVLESSTLNATVNINNTGEIYGATQKINLTTESDENQRHRDSKNATVDPGNESFYLNWNTSEGDAGEYNISVYSENDSDTREIEVLPSGYENLSINMTPQTAYSPAVHNWSFGGVPQFRPNFGKEVDKIIVDYPNGTSLDGLNETDITVVLTRELASGPDTSEISVNDKSYSGSSAVFDLSGYSKTNIVGSGYVRIDGISNPPEGQQNAKIALVDGSGKEAVSSNRVVNVSEKGPIYSCRKIERPGSYYLAGDLESPDDCINITSDDVYLDGRGNELNGTSNGRAIQVDGAENVTVRNFTVRNWNEGIAYDGEGTVSVEDTTVLGNEWDVSANSGTVDTNNLTVESPNGSDTVVSANITLAKIAGVPDVSVNETEESTGRFFRAEQTKKGGKLSDIEVSYTSEDVSEVNEDTVAIWKNIRSENRTRLNSSTVDKSSNEVVLEGITDIQEERYFGAFGEVTVKQNGLEITPSSIEYPDDENITIEATAEYTNGTVSKVTDETNFTVENTTVADIYENATLSTKTPGETELTAKFGRREVTKEVSVFKNAFFSTEIDDMEETVEGDIMYTTAEIRNMGEEDNVTQNVTLMVKNSSDVPVVEKERGVTLNGTEVEYVTFSWNTKKGDAGNYSLNVTSQDDSVSEQVRILKNASFELDILNPEGEKTIAGRQTDVDVEVTNIGDITGTKEVILTDSVVPISEEDLSGIEVIGAQNITLDGGETTNTTLTWETDSNDTNSQFVRVISENDTDSIPVNILEATLQNRINVAEEGEEVTVSGTVNESVVINKPVTIVGTSDAHLDGKMEINSKSVKVRNIEVDAAVEATEAPESQIEGIPVWDEQGDMTGMADIENPSNVTVENQLDYPDTHPGEKEGFELNKDYGTYLKIDSTGEKPSVDLRIDVLGVESLNSSTVWRMDERGDWHKVETSVDGNTVEANLAGNFSTFGVFDTSSTSETELPPSTKSVGGGGVPEGPEYEIRSSSISKDVSVGEEIIASLDVENFGYSEGDASVKVLHQGETVKEEEVSVPGYGERKISIKHTPEEEGEYRVKFDDNFVESITVSSGTENLSEMDESDAEAERSLDSTQDVQTDTEEETASEKTEQSSDDGALAFVGGEGVSSLIPGLGLVAVLSALVASVLILKRRN